MNNILMKNVCLVNPNDLAVVLKFDVANDFHGILKVFAGDLFQEAISSKTSSIDMKGIKSVVEENLNEIEDHMRSHWSIFRPVWHHYPVVLGKDSKLQIGALATQLEQNSEFEVFQSFVCSSIAFSNFSVAVSKFTNRPNVQQFRSPVGRAASGLHLVVKEIERKWRRSPPAPATGTTYLWFTCVRLAVYSEFFSMY
jgi:hypothetical protein